MYIMYLWVVIICVYYFLLSNIFFDKITKPLKLTEIVKIMLKSKLEGIVFVPIIICLTFIIQSCRVENIRINNLKCEYVKDPIGVDTTSPRFSWEYESDQNAAFEQGFIQLFFSENRDALKDLDSEQVCKTQKIDSDISFYRYDSLNNLQPNTTYYWKVIAWDKKQEKKIESPISQFRTAFFKGSDWSAVWISDNEESDAPQAPMLRKSFQLENKSIESAYLYISAAGYYDISINGNSIDSSVFLAPGYTHYDKRNLYNTYNVTSLLQNGENVISSVLGNGFYNAFEPVATWSFDQARWRDRASMICELHITYADKSTEAVISDTTWKAVSKGPFLQNNIYSGDTYDFRQEIKGWDQSSFDDSSWGSAVIKASPSKRLVAEEEPVIRKIKELQPISVRSYGDTVFVCDFGVNMSGTCQLNIQGEKGTHIDMQYGEFLKANGRLEMRNLDIYYKPLPGLPFQTDIVTLDGNKNNFTAKFSYKGFQYVEVRSNKPIKFDKSNIKAINFHSDLKKVGSFSCSNPLLNQIWEAANRSYLSNAMSIPTDCPQREKNGWTADAHVTIDLGLLNYDGVKFYEKWIEDLIDNQDEKGRISGIIPSSGWGYDDWIGPVWDAAMFIVPMALYNYYGDTHSINRIYNTCQKYLEYLKSREDADGTVTYGIGDWVPYKTQTPTEYTTSCYYYLDNLYMSQFAEILGKEGSVYKTKAENLKKLINQKYFNPQTNVYANGSQASLAVALYLGIVPAGSEQKVADNLYKIVKENNGYLDFGMLGSKTVLRMLSKYGYADMAYEMASKEDEPSWGAWIKKGFNTLPETWTLSPEFRDASINHMFLGDINAWMYNVLAGINYDPNTPGFKHILIEPHFVDGLDWVKSEYNSVKGVIRSEWKRVGNNIYLNVQVPINTTATIQVGNKTISVEGGKHSFQF